MRSRLTRRPDIERSSIPFHRSIISQGLTAIRKYIDPRLINVHHLLSSLFRGRCTGEPFGVLITLATKVCHSLAAQEGEVALHAFPSSIARRVKSRYG
jgi:hypothetical protein